MRSERRSSPGPSNRTMLGKNRAARRNLISPRSGINRSPRSARQNAPKAMLRFERVYISLQSHERVPRRYAMHPIKLRRRKYGAPQVLRAIPDAEEFKYIGEPGWDRTIDPLIKSQMLYP